MRSIAFTKTFPYIVFQKTNPQCRIVYDYESLLRNDDFFNKAITLSTPMELMQIADLFSVEVTRYHSIDDVRNMIINNRQVYVEKTLFMNSIVQQLKSYDKFLFTNRHVDIEYVYEVRSKKL